MNNQLTKQEKEEFETWVVNHFSVIRENTSLGVYQELSKAKPKLAKKIARLAKKNGLAAYVGRSLLRSLSREGWLTCDIQYGR